MMRLNCGRSLRLPGGACLVVPCLLVGLVPLAMAIQGARLAAAATGSATDQAAAPVTRFNIDEIRVEGNTLLPQAEIEDAIYGFVGPGKTAEDIERARATLDALYAKRGYPTVSAEIPRQRVSDGVIVLKITERKVGRLRVTGSRYVSLDRIKEGAPFLAEGTVPDINRVERDLQTLNQMPARTVTPVLRAGLTPGTVDVDLEVTDQLPAHGSLELNNRGNCPGSRSLIDG